MISEALWQSARNIETAQDNLDMLWVALDQIECDYPDMKVASGSLDSDGGDWITPVYSKHYSVRRRTKKNMVDAAWITITIQLTCDESNEVDWQYGKRAKLILGYSASKRVDEAWRFNRSQPDSAGFVEDCRMDGLRWTFDSDDGKSWFFSVPLDNLTSNKAVEELATGPMLRLIRGEDVQSVLGPLKAQLCVPPEG